VQDDDHEGEECGRLLDDDADMVQDRIPINISLSPATTHFTAGRMQDVSAVILRHQHGESVLAETTALANMDSRGNWQLLQGIVFQLSPNSCVC